MARSLIGGLLEGGFNAKNIRAFDPDPVALKRASELGAICTCQDLRQATETTNIVVLAVKPQVVEEACKAMSSFVKGEDVVVITIAAGVNASTVKSYFGEKSQIVRCMPNTPALIGRGVTGLFTDCSLKAEMLNAVEFLFNCVGSIHWVQNESDLDIVTALSGSGPAYFFLFVECLIDAAIKLGLDESAAISMAKATASGAAQMMLESTSDIKDLRDAVTSPGGTTERAIKAFLDDGLRGSAFNALEAAHRRALELAKEFEPLQ